MFRFDKVVHIIMIAILRHVNLQKRSQKALTIAQFVNSVQLMNQFDVNIHKRVSSKITKIDFLEPVELMVFVCKLYLVSQITNKLNMAQCYQNLVIMTLSPIHPSYCYELSSDNL